MLIIEVAGPMLIEKRHPFEKHVVFLYNFKQHLPVSKGVITSQKVQNLIPYNGNVHFTPIWNGLFGTFGN